MELAWNETPSQNLDASKPWKSISPNFKCASLPDFTILTGKNGSGKSHFFQAISIGRIKVDEFTNEEISVFDWTTFKASARKTALAFNDLDKLWALLQDAKSQHIESTCKSTGLNEAQVWAKIEENEPLYEYNLIESEQKLRNALSHLQHRVISTATNEQRSLRNAYSKFASDAGKPIIVALEQEFRKAIGSVEIEVDLFANALADIFEAFHSKQLRNLFSQFLAQQGVELQALSDEEFLAAYGYNGKAPWDVVNDYLNKAGLEFTVKPPPPVRELLRDQFSNTKKEVRPAPLKMPAPLLIKKNSGAEVKFEELSSGEMVLASLATALFNESSETHAVKTPKLLLLDEVDAPLHPEQIPRLLDTLENIFVAKHGIKVILATHKPSTVALANDSSVFLMSPDPCRIEFIGRDKSLRYLTEGLPSLSVAFDLRKQVLVESFTDSKRFCSLFMQVAKFLEHSGSLEFIAVGNRNRERSESNAGCDHVKKMVKQFRDAGNCRVLGLIDWDTKNSNADGIVVLSIGERYAIENLLLDPLLVAALLLRICKPQLIPKLLGLESQLSYVEIATADATLLQKLVDHIQSVVLDGPIDLDERVEVLYAGGNKLLISRSYLHLHGKALVSKLKHSFSILNRFDSADSLMGEVCDTVLRDYPEFCPRSLLNTFEVLLGDHSRPDS